MEELKKLYPDTKYVGLFNYRRFFAFDEQQFLSSIITKLEEAIMYYKINAAKVIKILESGKVILMKPLTFPYTVAAQYCMCCISGDYRAVKEIIRDKFSDYYDAFIDVMERNNKLHVCNMFVMKWEDFEKYCEWLFTVLEALDNKIP